MKRIRDISLVIIIILLMVVSFFNVKVNGTNIYSNYLPSKNLDTGLVYEPILTLELNSLDDLDSDANSIVTSVILNIDKDINVITSDNKYNFTEFFDEYIKGKYIPIVKLDSSNYKAFLSFWKSDYKILDLMILSSDIDIINHFYHDEDAYILNSVYDMRDTILPNNRYDNWEYVSKCNKAGCNILMASVSDSNFTLFTEYVQAMTKVSWGYGNGTIDSVRAIACGAYGVVNTKTSYLKDTLKYFEKTGWNHAQYVAAHRGITKYCNENSLTGCLAAYSEGATHIEVDLQVLADGNIVLCHNSQTNFNSNKSGWYFVNVLTENLKNAKLNDYNINYDETYTTLDELTRAMIKTDVIMIIELKFDNGSIKAVDDLKCIENFKRIMDAIPESYGHFYAITFFAPLAEKMKELMPEVPLGYIGGARSGKETDLNEKAWNAGGGHKEMTDYGGKIRFLRHYNIGLDESYVYATSDGRYYSNITASFYLARGYVQNTWTYEDTMHFAMKTSIATSNCAEEVAYLVKRIDDSSLSITVDELNSGKVKVKTYSYNGWMEEKECEIIVITKDSSSAFIMLYYYEDRCTTPYGLYSTLIDVTIK